LNFSGGTPKKASETLALALQERHRLTSGAIAIISVGT